MPFFVVAAKRMFISLGLVCLALILQGVSLHLDRWVDVHSSNGHQFYQGLWTRCDLADNSCQGIVFNHSDAQQRAETLRALVYVAMLSMLFCLCVTVATCFLSTRPTVHRPLVYSSVAASQTAAIALLVVLGVHIHTVKSTLVTDKETEEVQYSFSSGFAVTVISWVCCLSAGVLLIWACATDLGRWYSRKRGRSLARESTKSTVRRGSATSAKTEMHEGVQRCSERLSCPDSGENVPMLEELGTYNTAEQINSPRQFPRENGRMEAQDRRDGQNLIRKYLRGRQDTQDVQDSDDAQNRQDRRYPRYPQGLKENEDCREIRHDAVPRTIADRRGEGAVKNTRQTVQISKIEGRLSTADKSGQTKTASAPGLQSTRSITKQSRQIKTAHTPALNSARSTATQPRQIETASASALQSTRFTTIQSLQMKTVNAPALHFTTSTATQSRQMKTAPAPPLRSIRSAATHECNAGAWAVSICRDCVAGVPTISITSNTKVPIQGSIIVRRNVAPKNLPRILQASTARHTQDEAKGIGARKPTSDPAQAGARATEEPSYPGARRVRLVFPIPEIVITRPSVSSAEDTDDGADPGELGASRMSSSEQGSSHQSGERSSESAQGHTQQVDPQDPLAQTEELNDPVEPLTDPLETDALQAHAGKGSRHQLDASPPESPPDGCTAESSPRPPGSYAPQTSETCASAASPVSTIVREQGVPQNPPGTSTPETSQQGGAAPESSPETQEATAVPSAVFTQENEENQQDREHVTSPRSPQTSSADGHASRHRL